MEIKTLNTAWANSPTLYFVATFAFGQNDTVTFESIAAVIITQTRDSIAALAIRN